MSQKSLRLLGWGCSLWNGAPSSRLLLLDIGAFLKSNLPAGRDDDGRFALDGTTLLAEAATIAPRGDHYGEAVTL